MRPSPFVLRMSAAVLAVLASPYAVAAQATTNTPHGFIASRYDTHTSSNIYVGYTLGGVTPMVALVQNPRTSYRESILGVAHFGSLSPHVGLTYAVAAAHVTDTDRSWYGQLYLLPSVTAGRFESSGTLELYVPLDSKGVEQWAINPGNVFIRVAPKFKVGGVTVLSTQRGAPYSLGVGPSAQVRLPKGSLTLDWVLDATRWNSEVRVSFFSMY